MGACEQEPRGLRGHDLQGKLQRPAAFLMPLQAIAHFISHLNSQVDPLRLRPVLAARFWVSSVGNRIQHDAALEFICDGDALVVTKLDRFRVLAKARKS